MKSFALKALTFLIPHRCLLCREEVTSPHSLCASCWPKLSFIAKPFCMCCGFPFDFEVEKETLCGACLKKKPFFETARAPLFYSPASKALLLRFKHGDGTDLAPAFARWLLLAGRDLLASSDVLVPVPLHWRRLLKRRYNQAALLAKSLGKLSGLPYRPLGLERHRPTPSQGTLTRQQRHQNVSNAFNVPQTEVKYLKGKRVLLIDDVYTSGATAQHAAQALRKGGAQRVHVLTVARVKR